MLLETDMNEIKMVATTTTSIHSLQHTHSHNFYIKKNSHNLDYYTYTMHPTVISNKTINDSPFFPSSS